MDAPDLDLRIRLGCQEARGIARGAIGILRVALHFLPTFGGAKFRPTLEVSLQIRTARDVT